MIRGVALFLTVLTGFSGLVYEVVWQKYLATLLGSHSEATASVLAIFLGGLSVGYWLFGRVTRRVVERAAARGVPPRLLLVYGGLEFGIGVYVVCFPWFFRGVQALSFAIPHGASGLGFAIDVLLTVILIGPASVMMGGTIPILTQALSRNLEDATRFHAFIYAFNTAGAFLGAIAAGFYLIPVHGLMNVMLAMGTINLVAGSVFAVLGWRGRSVYSEPAAGTGAQIDHFASYGLIALLTGFAMMAIQTTIIRIGGLSFGSSEFTFSMVVAVFVLCIALGSFGVSLLSRIPPAAVVINQWGIGLILWLLYTQIDKAPYVILSLRTAVQDNTGAFALYYAAGFAVVLFAIGLPVFLSGAALPLLFHHMRRQVDHLGDLAGNLYSWNTVGSLLGALLGGYVLLFWLDLHHVYRLAVAALLVSAVLLSVRVYAWAPLVATGVAGVLLALLFSMQAWDPYLLYSGLFRTRDMQQDQFAGVETFRRSNPKFFEAPFLFIDDDPTASITVRRYPVGDTGKTSLTIATNGKSDGNSFKDYTTMGLAAAIPALLAEPAERAFVIGWGTGITAGELASLESMREIDVAELSPGVVAAAPLFDRVTMKAIQNPKVRVIRSDAYRALMRAEGTFDLIVSEPSNPWVTGVEMLFSREFLTAARDKLSPGGVYCQWIHQYESDSESLELVLRTYTSVFDHVAVWAAQHSDLLLLGFNDPKFASDVYRLEAAFDRPDFRASFQRAGVHSFPALLAHELIPLGVIREAGLEGPLHSLYHPRLAHTAGRAFFRGGKATVPFTGAGEAAKLGAKRSLLRRHALRTGGTLDDDARAQVILETCRVHNHRCQTMLAEWVSEDPNSAVFRETFDTLEQRVRDAERIELKGERANPEEMKTLAALFGPSRDATQSTSKVELRTAERASELFVDFYHHASPFSQEALLDLWSRCVETSPTAQACRERLGISMKGKPAPEQRARLQACREQRLPGPQCEAGLRAAESLVRAAAGAAS